MKSKYGFDFSIIISSFVGVIIHAIEWLTRLGRNSVFAVGSTTLRLVSFANVFHCSEKFSISQRSDDKEDDYFVDPFNRGFYSLRSSRCDCQNLSHASKKKTNEILVNEMFSENAMWNETHEFLFGLIEFINNSANANINCCAYVSAIRITSTTIVVVVAAIVSSSSFSICHCLLFVRCSHFALLSYPWTRSAATSSSRKYLECKIRIKWQTKAHLWSATEDTDE